MTTGHNQRYAGWGFRQICFLLGLLMRILHIATEKTWRGGENQLRLLLEGLADKPQISNHLATRPDTPTHLRLSQLAKIVLIPGDGYHPGAAWKLARYCLRNRIDLIDAHTSKAHSLSLLIKSFLPQIKLVVHRRVDNIPSAKKLTRWKYLSPKVDQYIAISSAIGQILINYGIDASRISVVKSAVPIFTDHVPNRTHEKKILGEKYGIDTDKVFIGNASALTAQKDFPTLLQTCLILKKSSCRFHCFIAGDGELKLSLQALTKSIGLEDCVTFIGFSQTVNNFLAALDILAFSSSNEGLGTILLDAIAAGCAIAATRVGGIPEIIIDGETGLLSPPRDPTALAAQVRRLIDNPELRSRLNSQALSHMKRNFSLSSMVTGNLSVYQNLLN